MQVSIEVQRWYFIIYRMIKQKLPTKEELEIYNVLCSKAFSRRTGAAVEVELKPFEIPNAHMTKSSVFGAYTTAKSEATVEIPSKIIVKRYIPGIIRTSEEEDTTNQEFRKERAVLDLDIHLNSGAEKIKVYPELYSGAVPECAEQMIILREFIHGENLEQIAKKQEVEGGIKWEAPVGTHVISDSLYPMALLHAQTPIIAAALKERGVLDFGTPEEASPAQISEDRGKRFVRYVKKLSGGLGKELGHDDKNKLFDAFSDLDRRFVSRKDLLSIIDAELDVFLHQAMLKRIPDAGGIEVGGFVRDLALYSAPVFKSLWGKPENMPEKVRSTYLNIRRQFEETLRCKSTEFNDEELDIGILLASFNGNLRKAAAVVHYNGRDRGYPVEQEVNLYLPNSLTYLDAFIKVVENEYSRKAKSIRDTLRKYGLGTDKYKLVYDRKQRISSIPGDFDGKKHNPDARRDRKTKETNKTSR